MQTLKRRSQGRSEGTMDNTEEIWRLVDVRKDAFEALSYE